jgi:hypothetical protein
MTALNGNHHLLDGTGRRRPRRGRVGAALHAARRCAVLPILDLHLGDALPALEYLPAARRCVVFLNLDLHALWLVPLQWGKKEEKK